MKKLFLSGLCFLTLVASITGYAQTGRLTSVTSSPNGASYFEISIQDSGLLNGKYKGWCGDWTTHIEHDVLYDAKFYSSYSELPPGLVDRPENLDEVNWIINQKFVGKNSPGGHGVYTYSDVQLAIWSLLDTFYDDSTVGPYSEARVQEIASQALLLGADFYPKCSQLVGILLEPRDRVTGNRVQTTISEVPRSHFPKCVIPDNDESL